ncbi:adenylate/guanylate cyclase domain-containing protein [Anaerolineales bacterium]
MKILVVDDNPANIDLIKDILSFSGHQVLSSLDGADAIVMVGKHMPDLVISDINMPGMSGIEVCRRLKADPETNSIPIIMLTALSDIDSRVEALNLGADDYLTKPYSPRELLARVERTLRVKIESDGLRETREVIRSTFERFVSASIVRRLLENPESVQLGGKLQPVTVFFADLESFTALSETTPPEKLLTLLSAYHSFLVKIIQQYNGTVDKFMGDSVMALYNTPIEYPDHIRDAVKTALHIQDDLHWFHSKVEPEFRLKVNFGIHTGMAVVGNVGTVDLMDFTAVGDTVNVAARLQGVADNGQILVSQEVYHAVEDFVIGRSKGAIYVKGRREPVHTFEISNTML